MEHEEGKIKKILETSTSRRTFLKGAIAGAGAFSALSTLHTITVPAARAAGPPAKDKMKNLFAQRENCTGCRACEYACSMKHEGITRPSASRIHVRRYHNIIDVPVLCWHCDDAPCVKACPTTPQAIYKDKETNAIKYIDDKTCLGAKCNKCIEACPSKFLRRHPDTGWPLFCDLCDGDPECVKACTEQSGNPQGPCLMSGKMGFGTNLAYRAVTPEEASEALQLNFFYPNEQGERR